MKNITLKDVAKKAGVGIGTASRVLNNHQNVSDRTRKIVLSAIDELDYQPDEIARSLKTKTTKNIGVILNDITNPFYADLLRGLETEASENNYSIVFIDVYFYKGSWITDVINFYKSKVDGIIYIGSTADDKIVKLCKKNNLPLVFASTSVSVSDKFKDLIYSVDIDDEKAAYDATMAMIKYGFKDIALILGSEDDKHSTYHRKIGYEKAMNKENIEINEKWIKFGDFTFESGYKAMKELLELESRPCAVFAISDLMAIGASKLLLEKGIKIPEEVAIMGFDGIKNSLYSYPEIATVNQPRYKIGKLACEKILNLINEIEVDEKISILKHKVIIRNSVKLPRP